MSNEATVKLTHKVQAHGQEISELVMRQPTGDDAMECGYPFRTTTDAKGHDVTIIDTEATSKMISALADVPLSTVRKLVLFDWNQAMQVIGLFMAGATPKRSKTSISTAPATGATSA